MLVEGINEHKKKWVELALERNKIFIEQTILQKISSLPIPVKYVNSNEFEEIWGKTNTYDNERFFNWFLGALNEIEPDNINEYRDKLSFNTEPIVAFVSDLEFYKLNKNYPDIITSPGVYVKDKEYNSPNFTFGLLYTLIKAQIYYSISRQAILKKYEGIDVFLYSSMTLKAMEESDINTLVDYQEWDPLGGNWAIPIYLSLPELKNNNKNSLDIMLNKTIIRMIIFGDDIDEEFWLNEITDKMV
ncbi:MAG: hypothetical protein KAT05_07745 [Spirochaetes bacterium]|nr:hypothetical protein [Spirochaetota bacterium]